MAARLTDLAKDSIAALALLAALGAVYTVDQRPLPLVAATAPPGLTRAQPEPSAPAATDQAIEPERVAEEDPFQSKFAAEFAVTGPAGTATAVSVPPLVIGDIKRSAPAVSGIKKERPKLLGSAPLPKPTATTVAPPPQRKPLEVEFFGIRSEATRSVVFVVDCSASMQGEKFEQVRFRLAQSIVDLQPEQSFFVVFFNNYFYPMLGLRNQKKLVPATTAMKIKALEWLARATPIQGTFPEPALFFSTHFGPQRIDFLTDGNFQPLSRATMNALASRSIKVNCFAFGRDCDPRNLQSIATQTHGRYLPVTPGRELPNLYFASTDELRDALQSSTSGIRALAINVIFGLELPLASEIIDGLRDPDVDTRNYFHRELIRVANGSDFGPAGGTEAEIAGAISRWHKWSKWHTSASEAAIAEKIVGADADERWVGVAIARQRGMDLPDELVKFIGDSNRQVRLEARAALVYLAKGPDFGPAPDAGPVQVADAARKWAKWRADQLAATNAVKSAANEKRAAQMLKLAKTYRSKAATDTNFEKPAQDKLAQIVQEFPDTAAAAEARTLLAK